ncbi:hypothetical protein F0562_001435 [Nyssa sinensis]|uniref:NOT2/NOT3/NOT5 C-terminal domain-containing protein n=1 Tax=Nyssa sinensis TaxID=561372 RepID=A0A5J5C6P9_9ASTE|nr:hypothetical protein F0562_001435 [Nyssa sinensis]
MGEADGVLQTTLIIGLLNSSLNGSASNLPDSAARSFATSFSAQSGAASPVFHHTGTIQGLHNIHGSFNVSNMQGTLASRNSTINNVPSSGVQQPTGSLSGGRFASNNLPVALSQISHGSSHGHSGVTNRGAIGNRSAVPGLGVSPILGNAGPRITSSMGNIVGGSNIGRSISSGGGLSVPGLASRLNLTANSGSGNLSVQSPNRLMSGVLQQASPQVISMLGNSYPTAGGPLSQSHIQAMNNLSSMGMLNDVNSNDGSPFDINDFPQLTSRPNSAGGPQGQLGSLRKQSLGVSPIVQQNQEFSIQNEDFPALPGFKGGNADYAMDLHQKEQLHDNTMSMMQSQHFSMGRSPGFNLGGSYSSHRPQQQQQHAASVSSSGVSFSNVNNQDLLHLHGSDMFPSSHSTYHSQTSGLPGMGLRPLNSPNTVSGMGSYDQLIQQYQQHQNQSQFRLQQMSTQKIFTRLLVHRGPMSLPRPFSSCSNICWGGCSKQYFSKFPLDTLFYIFYSMPKDEAQLFAANELYNRGWFYHRELRLWFMRVANMEPLVKTNAYERGSYICFDPNMWETIRKDNFVLHYDMLEKRPAPAQH